MVRIPVLASDSSCYGLARTGSPVSEMGDMMVNGLLGI